MRFILVLALCAAALAACGCAPDAGCIVITCPVLSVSSHASVVLLFGSLDVSGATSNPAFPSLVKITGDLAMVGNAAVTTLSLPLLNWIGDDTALIGDLHVVNNTALAAVNMPRLTDIYGRYVVAANPSLFTIVFGLLANVRSGGVPAFAHVGGLVCNYCSLCGLAANMPSLNVDAASVSTLYPWLAFSVGCAAADGSCNTCPVSPTPSMTRSATPTASMTMSASVTPSPTRSATPTASTTASAAAMPSPSAMPSPTPSPSLNCSDPSASFRWDAACANDTVLLDIGQRAYAGSDLVTMFPTYGVWGACTYLRTQLPWFSSSSNRALATALTTVGPTDAMAVMFWLRTSGATGNYQAIMSARLTNAPTPQIEGSLKGWNIYINTNYSANPAWYAEGNGPYLGWLSFWWSQCGNVTVLSQPITHGWRKFHIMNLGANSTDLNKFMHIAIVYSNAERRVSAYKNGILIGEASEATMGYWPMICGVNSTDIVTGAPAIRLGQNNENLFYPASIDLADVRVYKSPVNITATIATAAARCIAD